MLLFPLVFSKRELSLRNHLSFHDLSCLFMVSCVISVYIWVVCKDTCPRKFLTTISGNPRFKHMGGSSMSHGMRCVIISGHFRIFTFCFGNVLGVYFLNEGNWHLLMCLTWKHMPLCIIDYSTMFNIFFQHIWSITWNTYTAYRLRTWGRSNYPEFPDSSNRRFTSGDSWYKAL